MATKKASSKPGKKSTSRSRKVSDLSVGERQAKSVVGGAAAPADVSADRGHRRGGRRQL
jgi:hypothetical protein